MATFFDLSLELRDKVYHYLWLETPMIEPRNTGDGLSTEFWYRADSVTFDTCVDRTPNADADPLPLWLLTCRQMLEEGTKHFHRHGVSALTCTVPKEPRLARVIELEKSFVPRQLPSVLDVTKTKRAYVYLRARPVRERNPRDWRTEGLHDEDEDMMLEVAKRLVKHGVIRNLHILVNTIERLPMARHNLDWLAAVAPMLLSAPHLQKLQVTIRCSNMNKNEKISLRLSLTAKLEDASLRASLAAGLEERPFAGMKISSEVRKNGSYESARVDHDFVFEQTRLTLWRSQHR